MSDEQDPKDPKTPEPIPPATTEDRPVGRRSEPTDPGTYLRDGVPMACWNAAEHVGHCERCMMALRLHIEDTIVALLTNNGKTH